MRSRPALIDELQQKIEANLTNPQFGVEELAAAVSMSRSNLHRKLQDATGQSISQFIREYRLEKARKLLLNEDLTASEVAHQVGFSSATYFSKVYHDFYGYPPKETRQKANEPEGLPVRNPNKKARIYVAVGLVVLLFGFSLFYMDDEGNDASVEKSIAVLPFKNLSADDENQYFADGVMATILNDLSKMRKFRVISRTTMLQFKETDKSIPDIGAQLNADFILEGDVQKSANRVRINVQLNDVNRDQSIWSESYDRRLENIFAIQTEIAKNVSQELAIELDADERRKIASLGTDNIEAYDLFLKATFENQKFNNSAFYQSIQLLKQAIALDPDFYRAYTLLAWNYFLLGTIFGDLNSKESYTYAYPFIQKSIGLNPEFPDSYLIKGGIQYLHNWDFIRAEINFKKAMDLGFNQPQTTHYCFCTYTLFLIQNGKYQQAIDLIDKIKKIDPSFTHLHADLGITYFLMGQPYRAIESLTESLSYTDNFINRFNLGWVYVHQGKWSKAILQFKNAKNKTSLKPPRIEGFLAFAYYQNGQEENGDRIKNELKNRLKSGNKGVNFALAIINSRPGTIDLAFDYLEKAYQEHDPELLWSAVDPHFGTLHNDPRWDDLLKRIGFVKVQ